MIVKRIEQLERTKRWHEKIKDFIPEKDGDRELKHCIDILYAFFLNCHHLKDWLAEFDIADKNEIDILINSHIELQICRDLCIASKHFKINRPSIDANATIKVRRIINDEFGGGLNGWDLQCTEYTQYKVQQLGVIIHWPPDRPRHGGKWADIFLRNGLYRILDTPKAGCAMSFTKGLGEYGHVAFVEEAYKDGSIKISEANWPPPGKYNERILKVEEWRDKYGGKFVGFV